MMNRLDELLKMRAKIESMVGEIPKEVDIRIKSSDGCTAKMEVTGNPLRVICVLIDAVASMISSTAEDPDDYEAMERSALKTLGLSLERRRRE